MQITLYAPAITCDHCVSTIQRTVDTTVGARFLAGNADARRFSIEIAGGDVLEAVAMALAAEGYPLGDAAEAEPSAEAHDGGKVTRPAYRVTPTDAGAEINYDCPCGCTAGFALNRATAAQEPESCCCGRTMLAGRDAESRLRGEIGDVEAFGFDRQTLAMPWGQPVEVALATPAAQEQ